ncbi:winged helix-turn-helix domain-containing protein [Streptomyces sp. NPDC012765]|uniref:winged helix-turn-helix domain-containing protein n=1 Tax=Streptomyces sp. NPDC012765 TaxID=3155249 RepID=UPI0033CDFAE5
MSSYPLVGDGIDPAILKRTLSLPHPQMRVVTFYLTAMKDPEFDFGVVMTGQEIAEAIDMNRTTFSKQLPVLTKAGWLRVAQRHGNVTYYGLGPVAEPERSNVVPLRRTA